MLSIAGDVAERAARDSGAAIAAGAARASGAPGTRHGIGALAGGDVTKADGRVIANGYVAVPEQMALGVCASMSVDIQARLAGGSRRAHPPVVRGDKPAAPEVVCGIACTNIMRLAWWKWFDFRRNRALGG
jgi:hypothetical protein